jgi:tetratricopeptide (TPR) repeat protein
MQGEYDQAILDANDALQYCEKISTRLNKRASNFNAVQKCKADALHNIGTAHWGRGAFQEGIPFLEKAVDLNRSEKRYAAQSASLNNLALLYFNLRDYKKSLELHNEALSLRRKHGSELEVSSTLSNIGTIYHRLGDFASALANYQLSLVASQKSNYPHLICTSLMNIGTLHAEMHDYDKAIHEYKRALTIARESQDRHSEGNLLSNIALALIHSQSSTEAMPFIEEGLTLAQKIGDKSGQVHWLFNLVQGAIAVGKYQEAIIYADEALALLEQTGDKYYKTVMLYKRGELLIELRAPSQETKRTLDEALELATTYEFTDSAYKIHLALAALAERDGKLADAVFHLKKGHQIERDLFNEKKTSQIRNLQIAFEVEKPSAKPNYRELKPNSCNRKLSEKQKNSQRFRCISRRETNCSTN